MPRRFGLFVGIASLVAGTAVALTPGEARADIVPGCGNFDFAGNEQCMLVTSGGCMAMCTPPSFQLQCSADLEASCSGGCTTSLDVNCDASCSASCSGSCSAHPGMFDCQGSCNADCEGHCMGQCASDANQSECEGSCKASCGARCNVSCMGVPPSVDCNAGCMASCKGSCTAQANFNCDISCSEKGYAMCEAKYSGGCNVMCSQPMGSLNCGGQWVNTQDLQTCIDSLKSMFNIEVSGSASGNCSGDTCSGQAQGSIKCDVGAPGEPALPGGLVAGGLGFAAIALARRAKRAR